MRPYSNILITICQLAPEASDHDRHLLQKLVQIDKKVVHDGLMKTDGQEAYSQSASISIVFIKLQTFTNKKISLVLLKTADCCHHIPFFHSVLLLRPITLPPSSTITRRHSVINGRCHETLMRLWRPFGNMPYRPKSLLQ
ncbi:hypothetical protein ILYODFUR_034821 [Ilyodon furcidens]|uniref:Uncharacterized protein n=1 Tax=Ilyodon furcidens TaxID=33524 RepID=A0ABV0VJK1_9TELE